MPGLDPGATSVSGKLPARLDKLYLGRQPTTGRHRHDSIALRLSWAKHHYPLGPGASRMSCARNCHGEMRRTGAPRERQTALFCYCAHSHILPQNPPSPAPAHACHDKCLDANSEPFHLVTSQHASSASAPAVGREHRKFCQHYESHPGYGLAREQCRTQAQQA